MARDVEFQEHAVGAWRPVRRRLIPPFGGMGWPWGPPVEFGYYPPNDAQRVAKLLSGYLADSGMGPNFWGEAYPDAESGGASVVLEVVFAPVVVKGQSLLPKQAFALAQMMAEKFTQASGWAVSVQWSHTK
jgi:hypothetical protein